MRETLEFDPILFDEVCLEDGLPDDYKIVEKNQTYFDSEKGFCQFRIIIQRLSDGKFFKGLLTDLGRGNEEVDTEWVEVFQKPITQYIYE